LCVAASSNIWYAAPRVFFKNVSLRAEALQYM
jgi:hypothetical protein